MAKLTKGKKVSITLTIYFVVIFVFLAFAFVGLFNDTYSDLITKITRVFLEM